MHKHVSMVIVALAFVTGCASMIPEQGKLELAGRYDDLARHMENSITDMSKATNMDLRSLCTAYSNLKNYRKLFPCLNEMQARIDRGDTALVNISLQGGLGDIRLDYGIMRTQAFIETGDYSKAILYGLNLVKLIGPNPVRSKTGQMGRRRSPNYMGATTYIKAWGLLGLAYALKGEQDGARQCLHEVELTSTERISSVADSKYLTIAGINMALGQYKQAREALESLKREGSDVYHMLGTVSLGKELSKFRTLPNDYAYYKVLLETGDVAQAKQGYDELLKVQQIRQNGTIYWLILFDRGQIAELEGDLKLAIDLYRQAVDVIEQQRSTINTEASKIGFVGDKQTVYHRLIATLFSDRQYSSALEYIERSKSRALVDMLASKKDFAVQAGNEQQVRELLARADGIDQEFLVQEENAQKDHTRSVIIQTKERLKQQDSELASLVSVTSTPVSEIQKLIPGDETLVEYYYTDKDLYVFVLTSNGISAGRLENGNLADEIRDFRKSLENVSSGFDETLARRLFYKLVKPVQGSLSTKRLTIVPHGALHYIPFNALQDGKQYLIERYSIRVLPSASVLKYLKAGKANKPGGILVFGNPDLGDPRYDLANAQNEAVAVAKMRSQSKVFLRKEATVSAFKKYSSGFNCIHFATHGQFDPDAPLKSALLLAKDAESDGMLTVDQLYSMKLDADLVTLSACETGLSKIANGDDLVGLTRGFLYAGASSIVASLWQVDDLATSQLMTRFYSEMNKTNKREALRDAQLETKKKYPHPYYWAAFQLTGSAI